MAKEFHTDVDLKGAVLLDGSAGASGYVFKSQGPGLKPVWAPESGGGGGFSSGTSAPPLPNAGDRWFDTDLGIEFTYISDGDSSQWVETSSSSTSSGASALHPIVANIVF